MSPVTYERTPELTFFANVNEMRSPLAPTASGEEFPTPVCG
jgi:hypothetical protein